MSAASRITPILFVLALAGCGSREQDAARDLQLADLTSKAEALATRVDALERARNLDDFLKGIDAIAYLTPGAAGYSVIRTDLGPMTVSLENVQAYANGSRITLQFGNLTSATVNGAKVKVEWGSVDAKGSPNNESARSRDVTFTQALRSGRWTNAPIVLEGVPPTELGFVRVKEFGHSGIVLLR